MAEKHLDSNGSTEKELDTSDASREHYSDAYVIPKDALDEILRYARGIQRAAGGLAHATEKLKLDNRARGRTSGTR